MALSSCCKLWMIITGEGTYVRCTLPWENIGGPDCANGPWSGRPPFLGSTTSPRYMHKLDAK